MAKNKSSEKPVYGIFYQDRNGKWMGPFEDQWWYAEYVQKRADELHELTGRKVAIKRLVKGYVKLSKKEKQQIESFNLE